MRTLFFLQLFTFLILCGKSYGMKSGSIHLIDDILFTRCYQDTIPADSLQAVRSDSSIRIDSLEIQDTVSVHTDTISVVSVEEPAEPETEIILPMGDISFADSVVIYDPGAYGQGTGDEPETQYQDAASALGPPDYMVDEDAGFVSLGKGGYLVLKFTNNVLVDGPGPDLRIFQAGRSEALFVWISKDGNAFIPAGKIEEIQNFIDIGPFVETGAVYPYIRLRDDPLQGQTDEPALGADIDAVGAVNSAIQIVIDADSLFVKKKNQFTQHAPEILARIANSIRWISQPHVTIEVHTDGWGTEEFNMIISQSQATSIRDYFLDEEQLSDVEYSILGQGESKRIASDDSENGRRKNRRIEFLVKTLNQGNVGR